MGYSSPPDRFSVSRDRPPQIRLTRGPTLQVYNEHKPRLAVSGWFHEALEAEMGDWPECTMDTAKSKSDAEGGGDGGGGGDGDGGVAASTLEQLKGAAGGGAAKGGDGDGDGSSPGVSFTDDFVGTEVRKNCLEAFRNFENVRW